MKTAVSTPDYTAIMPIQAVTTREDANALIARNRQKVRIYVERHLRELGMTRPICDLDYGLPAVSHQNPYDDIVNMASWVNNAYMEAWGFFFRYVEACRKLAELKGRRVEVTSCDEVSSEPAHVIP